MAYTGTMSIAAKAQDAPKFIDISVSRASWLLAVIFAVMVTSQLFTFEKFPEVLGSYWLLGDQATAHLAAALLVTAEVFTLPFLLRIRASPLLRLVSLGCAWAAAMMWFGLSAWAVTQPNAITNAGLLGATIRTPSGVLPMVFSLFLLGLVGYITWRQRQALRLRQ